MRDVRNELPLDVRQLLKLLQLLLEARGHIVERGGQRGQLVGAAYFHPLAQLSGR
jgi:hypothetical protein